MVPDTQYHYLSLMLDVGRHFIKMSDKSWSRNVTREGGDQHDQQLVPQGKTFHVAALIYASYSNSHPSCPSLPHHTARLFPMSERAQVISSSASKRRIAVGIDPRPKTLHVVPEAGVLEHCIIPAHVLGIKAAVAIFASLRLTDLCSVLLCAALIMHCWSFSHRQGNRNRMQQNTRQNYESILKAFIRMQQKLNSIINVNDAE